MIKEDFNIILNNSNNFYNNWDKFLLSQKNGGPFYSSLFLKQMVERGKSSKKDNDYNVKDLSFYVSYKEKIAALVPLVIEHSNKKFFFSTNLNFNTFYAPLISLDLNFNEQNKLRNFIFNHLDEIAKKQKVKKSFFVIDPINYFYAGEYYNYLQSYGYIDSSIQTSIIDLTTNMSEIKKNIRKSYTQLINRGIDLFEFKVFNHQNIDPNNFNQYVLLHEKAAGFKTRSSKSFETQYQSIQNNLGTLILTYYKDKVINANYFSHFNDYVYYSSNANDEDFKEVKIPKNHSSIFFAIKYFQEKQYKYFELGWQKYSQQILEEFDKKSYDISFFTRGFGGKIIPLFRGLKYYDKKLLSEDLAKF